MKGCWGHYNGAGPFSRTMHAGGLTDHLCEAISCPHSLYTVMFWHCLPRETRRETLVCGLSDFADWVVLPLQCSRRVNFAVT